MTDTSRQADAEARWLAVGYACAGASVALLYAFAAIRRQPTEDASAFVVVAGVAGAIVGYSLFVMRQWRGGSPARRLLRWVLGGAVAGALIAITGAFGNSVTPLSVALGAGIGACMTSGFGLQSMRREYLRAGEDHRTGTERRNMWLVFLGVFLATFVLMLLAAPAA